MLKNLNTLHRVLSLGSIGVCPDGLNKFFRSVCRILLYSLEFQSRVLALTIIYLYGDDRGILWLIIRTSIAPHMLNCQSQTVLSLVFGIRLMI